MGTRLYMDFVCGAQQCLKSKAPGKTWDVSIFLIFLRFWVNFIATAAAAPFTVCFACFRNALVTLARLMRLFKVWSCSRKDRKCHEAYEWCLRAMGKSFSTPSFLAFETDFLRITMKLLHQIQVIYSSHRKRCLKDLTGFQLSFPIPGVFIQTYSKDIASKVGFLSGIPFRWFLGKS